MNYRLVTNKTSLRKMHDYVQFSPLDLDAILDLK